MPPIGGAGVGLTVVPSKGDTLAIGRLPFSNEGWGSDGDGLDELLLLLLLLLWNSDAHDGCLFCCSSGGGGGGAKEDVGGGAGCFFSPTLAVTSLLCCSARKSGLRSYVTGCA